MVSVNIAHYKHVENYYSECRKSKLVLSEIDENKLDWGIELLEIDSFYPLSLNENYFMSGLNLGLTTTYNLPEFQICEVVWSILCIRSTKSDFSNPTLVNIYIYKLNRITKSLVLQDHTYKSEKDIFLIVSLFSVITPT
jgi:hypothetical protein